jgi:hypothetical protein
MRVVPSTETHEQHFTEGEPDLEPPEEFAIAEMDDVAVLEEELDNEDVLEQDVEEDVLEETLEDLVHGGDDEREDDAENANVGNLANVGNVRDNDDLDRDDGFDESEERGGEDDEEEGLDRMLEHRLAVDDEQAEDDESSKTHLQVPSTLGVLDVGVALRARRVHVHGVLPRAQPDTPRRHPGDGLPRLHHLNPAGSKARRGRSGCSYQVDAGQGRTSYLDRLQRGP